MSTVNTATERAQDHSAVTGAMSVWALWRARAGYAGNGADAQVFTPIYNASERERFYVPVWHETALGGADELDNITQNVESL